jgi:pyruvate/2-oxoglutarate dehydrogenase complex dihydrolipoamide dehydrogenase (E3) component
VADVDFLVVGAGPAGEAAAGLALARGASVAVVEDELIGGACAYWACMPSKALLHAAAVHHGGGDFPWQKASEFRDYMINRESGEELPDDSGRLKALTDQGGRVVRGRGRIVGPGRVRVTGADGATEELSARHILIAVGSRTRIPEIAGLGEAGYWTNREGTSTRQLPRSLLIMGGGPTGVELAQVFARYGVPTTIVDSNQRLLAREHPRSSQAIREGLERDGVTVRLGVRAGRVEPGAGRDGGHVVHLSDGSTVEGHEVLVAIGRTFPLHDLGLESLGVELDERGAVHPDASMRIAPEVYVIGDPAGPELHTHLAHYQGEMAVRIALGDEVGPDYRAIPRAVYTDPAIGSVGLLLEEALAKGLDAFEETEDLATSAKGYVTESGGHVTLVVDRRDQVLLGAFIAGVGAPEAIHEAVLAIKLGVPLHVLADTIHAFPTTARVLGGLFAKVSRQLEGGAGA